MNKLGKVICVTSGKGGTGKTMLATNIAGLLANHEKKVLIIDLDLYSGGVGLSLDLNSNKSIYDLIHDIEHNRYQKFDNYILKYNDHIDVLLAPNDPREASKTDARYLPNLLSYAKSKYHAVIIDTTHVFNPLNVLAIDHSDVIIQILTNNPIDLKNTRNKLKLYKESNIDNIYVVLNEAVDHANNYYTLFDIKNIINHNIDYTLTKNFYMKNYDKYTINGKIPSLETVALGKYRNDWKKLYNMLDRIFEPKGKGGIL